MGCSNMLGEWWDSRWWRGVDGVLHMLGECMGQQVVEGC